jgi:hypothetical protein
MPDVAPEADPYRDLSSARPVALSDNERALLRLAAGRMIFGATAGGLVATASLVWLLVVERWPALLTALLATGACVALAWLGLAVAAARELGRVGGPEPDYRTLARALELFRRAYMVRGVYVLLVILAVLGTVLALPVL